MAKSKEVRKQGVLSMVLSGIFRAALYVLIIFGLIYLGKSSYHFGYEIFHQTPVESGEGREMTVVIKDGTSTYQIGRILENKGLIEDARIFVIQEKLSNYKGKLRAGTYVLNTNMTADEIMAVLSGEADGEQPSGETADTEVKE